MKKSIFIIIVFLVLGNLFSQNNKTLLSVSVGEGIPVGNFASKNGSTFGAGYAKAGLTYKASLSYLLTDKIGVTCMFQNVQNPINTGALSNQIDIKYPNQSTAWSVSSKPWNTNLLMVGVMYYVPLIKNKKGDPFLFLDLKAMLGSAFVSLPHQNISTNQNNVLFTGTQNKDLDVDPAVALGAKLRCKIYKGLFGHLSAEYFTTTTQFQNVTEYFSNGTTNVFTRNQKISVVSLTAGIDFLF
jgi:hypothetical protein